MDTAVMNAESEVSSSGASLLVCVCGGIAAYKVCHVVSRFAQRNITVRVAMTAHAGQFVGPLTFEALSGMPVLNSLWQITDAQDPQHINLARRSACILIAPATANMLAKMAHGIADDLVSTLVLAADPEKIIVAPAMNDAMWTNPATQANVEKLRGSGIEFVGPETGWQACRTTGIGRMSEPDAIVSVVQRRIKL